MQNAFKNFYRLKDSTIDNAKKNKHNIYLSQDLREGRGEKRFYEVPLNQINDLIEYIETDNNLYEIIPENTEVRPYFDLEIEEEQAHIRSYERVKVFLEFLNFHFSWVFNIALFEEDYIILNSTRENKLSYHIVLKNYKFKNNAEQKIFIKYLQNQANEMEKSHPYFLSMTWLYKNTEQRFIFDCIPYNKNQNIRLVNQSKKGKPYNLRLETETTTINTFCRVLPSMNCEFLNIDKIKQEILNKKALPQTRDRTKTKIKKVIHNDDLQDKTLYEYYNMTPETLKKEPLFYQYLAIIPNNKYINWEIYRNIGFALKGCNADIRTFLKWASLSNKFDENDQIFQDYGKFKTKNDVVRYDERYLRNLAKELNNETYNLLFDNAKDRINEYLTCDYTGFKRIDEDSKYICTREDGNFNFYPDLEESNISVLHSHMGKGKTTYIRKVLSYLEITKNYDTVLFISSRQSFANFITGSFRNVINYMEYKGKEIRNIKKIVCSLESLHKIHDDTKFDIIILDECESILKQFSSHTVQNKALSFQLFKQRIEYSKKAIFADAFITNRTLNFIRNCYKNKSKCILTNFKVNEHRRAQQIKNDEFNQEIISHYRNDKKIYACFSSKAKQEDLYKDMRQEENFKNKSIFYNAENNKEICEGLKDVNNHWKNKKIISTTAKITVGVSYDNDENLFDYAYINGSCNIGPSVRDIQQMIMRVRHLKTNKIKFTLPTRKFGSINFEGIYNSFESFLNQEQAQVDLLLSLVNRYGIKQDSFLYQTIYNLKENQDIELKRIMYANIKETIVSQSYFSELFIHMLKLIGYKVSELLTDDEQLKREFEDIDLIQEYNEIEDIKPDEARIMANELRFDRDEQKQKQVDKYFFNKMWNEATTEEKKARLFQQYRNKYKKQIFENVKIEKRKKTLVSELQTEINKFNDSIAEMPMTTAKLDLIKQINKLLSLEHSQDQKEIKKEVMTNAYEYIKQNKDKVKATYNRDLNFKGSYHDDKICFNAINDIYGNWSGMKLAILEKNSHTKKATKYGLAGISFYDDLKKYDVFEEN